MTLPKRDLSKSNECVIRKSSFIIIGPCCPHYPSWFHIDTYLTITRLSGTTSFGHCFIVDISLLGVWHPISSFFQLHERHFVDLVAFVKGEVANAQVTMGLTGSFVFWVPFKKFDKKLFLLILYCLMLPNCLGTPPQLSIHVSVSGYFGGPVW